MHPVELSLPEVDVFSVAMHQRQAQLASQPITDGDPANAAQECSSEGGCKLHLPFVDQIAGERHQRLVGNRQANDPKHQKAEYAGVSVNGNPLKNAIDQQFSG